MTDTIIDDAVKLSALSDDTLLNYVLDLTTNEQATQLEVELAHRLQNKLKSIEEMKGDEDRYLKAMDKIQELERELVEYRDADSEEAL